MRRNLDMTALRALAAVADFGGVTRAAHALHLTQSAVSMQIKRLEAVLGLALLDRNGRGVTLTSAGEQLLGYTRRMLALNDEVVARLTDSGFEGELVLCVPHDIVYPVIPKVLQRFRVEFPRMRVRLQTINTRFAKQALANGECDLILTTETHLDPDGETLTWLPLVWIGAPGGQAWRQRPLRLAMAPSCAFRAGVLAAVERAGIPWEAVVESESDRTIEATVASDMAVHVLLAGTEPIHAERIPHGGALPELTRHAINLYLRPGSANPGVAVLAALLRDAWRGNETVSQVA